MAIRFGGRFSPGAKQQQQPQPSLPVRAAPGHLHHPLETRTKWILAAASPLLIGAFFQDPVGMAASLAGFGILAGGMIMTRQGLQAQAAYEARSVAKRPAIPRKLFGGVLTGLGLAVGAAQPDALAGAGVIGLMGAGLHWLSFGGDPMRDKGMDGPEGFQQERVARVIAEADAHLTAMRDAIARIGDPALEGQVRVFADTAWALFRRVEGNPAALTSARRYLGVWLLGARDATVAFADLYTANADPAARQAWQALMADLTTEFAARSEHLIEGGRTELDIEIGVLRDRLVREGVAGKQPPAQIEDRRAVTLDELLRTHSKQAERR